MVWFLNFHKVYLNLLNRAEKGCYGPIPGEEVENNTTFL